MDSLVIVVLVAASAVGSGLIFLGLRRTGHKQAEYAAFAQSQGWDYANVPPDQGGPPVPTFRDPSDDWTLRIHFSGGGATGGSTSRRVEWHSPQGALTDGEAALGMPLPDKTVRVLQMGGPIAQQVLTAALKATLHALGQTKFTLKVDEATAGDPGGVVMASDGQARAMDALRPNATLAAFRTTHKPAQVPVILRHAQGLTLRRPGAVKELHDLTAFAALGCALRAAL